MIETSPSALKSAIAKLDITWKNVLPIPVDWNKPEIIQAHATFVATLSSLVLTQKAVIYIDEKPWNMHKKKSKGHAMQGEPAKLTLVPKGKNITLIAALSTKGLVHTRIVEGLTEKKKGTNAEDF